MRYQPEQIAIAEVVSTKTLSLPAIDTLQSATKSVWTIRDKFGTKKEIS
jgi:hypothetical protein